MRLSIATPGNDFRLGACEAPPSIISMYLGEDMTNFLDAYRSGMVRSVQFSFSLILSFLLFNSFFKIYSIVVFIGSDADYEPITKVVSIGCSSIPDIIVPSEDRNRTSPFPYGGHRFEFRAVGSSQNVSLVNTVLASITAKIFKEFSNEIEKGVKPAEVAKKALNEHWKVIFNGNGYDAENQKMLTERGLWRIDSNVDAITRFTEPKNIALFEELGVSNTRLITYSFI